MSAEWISALAAVGTLLVIGATAFAALVQLRHIRAANQLTGLLHFSELFEMDAIQSANAFIERELPNQLRDANFVTGLLEANTDRRTHPELRVCDFLEQQGSYIKYGMIAKDQYIDLVGAYVTSMWDALRQVVALRRVARNNGGMYENFEFLASLARTRTGRLQGYPRDVPVLLPENQWRAIARSVMQTAAVSFSREASSTGGEG